MGENNKYDPDVYRRLDLVQKQFKQHRTAEQKERIIEKRRQYTEQIRLNRTRIGRTVFYFVLGAVLAAVILVVIFDKV